jgi:hypothetical protein
MLAPTGMEQRYLRTDHWTDAVWSLEAALEFSARLPADEAAWKWLLISVHSAVQGFMAIALEHGNALLVMKDHIMTKWLKAHDAGQPYPEARMDYFLSLYEKVKSDAVCGYVGSKHFIADANHDYSMKKLNELRNGFIHFFPQGWSIELKGLPAVCLRSIDVAQFLAWDSRTIIWHSESLEGRASAAMSALRTNLEAMAASAVR